eukprot:UN08536
MIHCTRVVKDLALIIYGQIMSKSLLWVSERNKISLEGCIWHPIKAYLCQKQFVLI